MIRVVRGGLTRSTLVRGVRSHEADQEVVPLGSRPPQGRNSPAGGSHLRLIDFWITHPSSHEADQEVVPLGSSPPQGRNSPAVGSYLRFTYF